MVRCARAAAAAFALFIAPRAAEAAPVLRIKWPTIPGCPDSSVVVQRARAVLAQAKEVDDVLAIAEITPPAAVGDPWQLHVRVRTVRGAGERSLEAPSCEAVARAAGLLVALAALRARGPDTAHPLDELAPASDLVPNAEVLMSPLALPTQLAELPAVRTGTDGDEERFVPSAGFGIAMGILPNIAVGPNASFGYESGPWSANVGIRALLPQEATSRGLGANFVAFGGRFDLCRRLPLPDAWLTETHSCVGAIVDDIHASGVGKETFDARRTMISALVGLGARWAAFRVFRIGADVRVGAAFERPSFVVESVPAGERELHRPSIIQGEGTLTFGLVF